MPEMVIYVLCVLVSFLVILVSFLVISAVLQWLRIFDHQQCIDEATKAIRLHNEAAKIIYDNNARINTVIDILIRNAKAESVIKGLATMNSPIFPTEETRIAFAPISHELTTYYKQYGHNLSERDLFLDVTNKFSDLVFKEVALKLGLEINSCIAMAIEVMKGQDINE